MVKSGISFRPKFLTKLPSNACRNSRILNVVQKRVTGLIRKIKFYFSGLMSTDPLNGQSVQSSSKGDVESNAEKDG